MKGVNEEKSNFLLISCDGINLKPQYDLLRLSQNDG